MEIIIQLTVNYSPFPHNMAYALCNGHDPDFGPVYYYFGLPSQGSHDPEHIRVRVSMEL